MMVLGRTAVRKIRERSKKEEVLHLLLCRSPVSSLRPFRAEPHGHAGAAEGGVQDGASTLS